MTTLTPKPKRVRKNRTPPVIVRPAQEAKELTAVEQAFVAAYAAGGSRDSASAYQVAVPTATQDEAEKQGPLLLRRRRVRLAVIAAQGQERGLAEALEAHDWPRADKLVSAMVAAALVGSEGLTPERERAINLYHRHRKALSAGDTSEDSATYGALDQFLEYVRRNRQSATELQSATGSSSGPVLP